MRVISFICLMAGLWAVSSVASTSAVALPVAANQGAPAWVENGHPYTPFFAE